MASYSRDKNGTFRFQVVMPDGSRPSLRFGRLSKRQAEAVKTRLDQLRQALVAGGLEPEAAAWVANMDDATHEKLAKAGLVESRERANGSLGQLLDAFFGVLDVRDTTATTYRQTRAALEAHFGAECKVRSITRLDAEHWRQAMKDDGLAPSTISKRVKTARQIFRHGIKWGMLAANPLEGVKAGAQRNPERLRFIPRDVIAKVIDAAPDAEWRLLIALSRFAGLRCPSEHLALRWSDLDWERARLVVRSRKTSGHEGRDVRHVPILPELLPHLREAFEQAPEGAEWVIGRHRLASVNLRTGLLRIIDRAGVEAWPRLFHNLRASCQTELAARFPAHVVCAWLGNSEAVAMGHYLQVRDSDFEAASKPSESAVQNAAHSLSQNAAQQGAVRDREDSHETAQAFASCGFTPENTTPRDCSRGEGMTPRGFEPLFPG